MDPMILLICVCAWASASSLGFALHPSSETSTISQRLEGLKSSQQQNARTSLRDQDEMGKSPFTRVVLPMVDKVSKLFSQMTPVTALNSAKLSIIRAGMVGKVTPTQITTLSYVLMILVPVMSLSFTGIPTDAPQQADLHPHHRCVARLPPPLRLCSRQGQGAPA